MVGVPTRARCTRSHFPSLAFRRCLNPPGTALARRGADVRPGPPRRRCAPTCTRSNSRCGTSPPRYGGDPEWWGVVGLLHDFDYERFPNDARAADQEHPSEGVRHLRAEGFPDEGCAGDPGPRRLHRRRPRRPISPGCSLPSTNSAASWWPARWCGPARSLDRSRAALGDQEAQGQGIRPRREPRRCPHGRRGAGVPLDELIAEVIAALRPHEAELGLGAG